MSGSENAAQCEDQKCSARKLNSVVAKGKHELEADLCRGALEITGAGELGLSRVSYQSTLFNPNFFDVAKTKDLPLEHAANYLSARRLQ